MLPDDSKTFRTSAEIFCPQCGRDQLEVKRPFKDGDKDNTEIQSAASLDKVLNMLNSDESLYIELSGHADHSINEDENIQVSLDRALLVRNYLVEHGIKKSRLRANGYGSSRPIDKEKGSSRNQWIEVTVIREG